VPAWGLRAGRVREALDAYAGQRHPRRCDAQGTAASHARQPAIVAVTSSTERGRGHGSLPADRLAGRACARGVARARLFKGGCHNTSRADPRLCLPGKEL
jgi:hypothetical protein